MAKPETHPGPSTPFSVLIKRGLKPILVVDPDADFLQKIQLDPLAKALPPVCASTPTDAQNLFIERKARLAGIFINPAIEKPNASRIVRAAHFYMPGVPIFFIQDPGTEAEATIQELNQMGVQCSIRKPLEYGDLLKMLFPSQVIFDPNEAIEIAKSSADSVNEEIATKDEHFFPTRAESFLAGSKSFFDLYIRLKSGRYVKVLNAGDTFIHDRLVHYMGKGVASFFIRKEARQHYINYCDKLASAIIMSPSVATSVKLAQTLHHGEEIVKYLKEKGIAQEDVEYARSFVRNVEELVDQLDLKAHEVIKDFVKNLTAYDHGASVSLIASLIVRAMNYQYGKATYTIGMASLLHDIGLDPENPKVQTENEAVMDKSEREYFRTHPSHGAILLKNIRSLHSVVSQAVEQHHERRNGTGFPQGLRGDSVILAAEMVGISDEIFHRLESRLGGGNARFAGNPLDGFSKPVLIAARKAFGDLV